MTYEPVQKDIGIGIEMHEKPIELKSLIDWDQYIQWKELRLFPYQSKKERFPFIQIKNKVLYAYNHRKYKWFTIFSEIVDFLGCKWNTLNYHLKKIEKKGFDIYIENRSDFAVIKFFDNIENPQERLITIPYTTFWALLESYKTEISEEILKKLHEVDYERMVSDEKQQTLIEQIKGEKALSQILFEEIDKCETLYQIGVFTYLFEFFPQARVEVKFYDPDKRWDWRMDIIIGNLILELDGMQHRFDDERFLLDEEKDTFNFENGKYTFRRSNGWWVRNFKKFPIIIENFMKGHKELL